MRHINVKEIIKTELKDQLQNKLRNVLVKLVFQLLIPCVGFAQENPWEQQQGENPWSNNTEITSATQTPDTTNSGSEATGSRQFTFNTDSSVVSPDQIRKMKRTLFSVAQLLSQNNQFTYSGSIPPVIYTSLTVPLLEKTIAPKADVPQENQADATENQEQANEETPSGQGGQRNKKLQTGVGSAVAGVLLNFIIIYLVR